MSVKLVAVLKKSNPQILSIKKSTKIYAFCCLHTLCIHCTMQTTDLYSTNSRKIISTKNGRNLDVKNLHQFEKLYVNIVKFIVFSKQFKF